MKWNALIKLMILCLVVLGMSVFSNELLRGMNKADIIENTAFAANPATTPDQLAPMAADIWGIPVL